ncbi:C3a anaphylatoxin chemotactic receptor-like [Cheilinus undulatus]|uniref:C3a anaphylatoxin chemotactic receptor-like n=1 Tax=Cheilinus undulatus TaxID=241271 RepID=UPI001BD3E220|nr:C3a anaphylatoxin chemotactic receptor-like [Cheilinus undulatus]
MGNATVSEIVNTVTLVTYSAIFILGILGNGLVIYVTGFRMKRTVNSVWFLNLALADFLFTTFMIVQIITVSQNNQWLFGWLMCKLNTFVSVINLFASIFLLAAISLDRCLSVCVVVWAQNKRTVRKAQLTSCVIWLAAVVCSTPYATYRDIRDYKGLTVCSVSEYYRENYYTFMIFRFVVGFLIPFLVIFVSYLAIGVRARRLQRTRKKRSRRIIFAVVLAFFVCWLPFHVMQFVQSSGYKSSETARNIGQKLSVCLAYLNSCLNPILYVFMCDEFQKKLKQSICLVLESALAEDHLTFMSSRSLSSQLSRISRKSDAASPLEGKTMATGFKFTESKMVSTDERDSDHS